MKHIVQYSTGLASAEVARRLVQEHGPRDVVLLTANTTKEDPDNWRFAHEVYDRFLAGCEWVFLADGRSPMQVGRDERVVPNNRLAVCSKKLKRELLRRWIDEHCDPAEVVIALGYDWTEEHRIKAAWPLWEPYKVVAPLAKRPFVMKEQLREIYRERYKIETPRLYAAGFQHANCGGACVRGGQAQWELLLRWNRERYLEWEADEEATRAELGKDVSILRDRSRGATRPLTLRTFRKRLELQPSLFDADDWGACGCLSDQPEAAP
ncbi:hypothetical protein Ssi03_51010 [Sphaerisporangium siamense]|uniref:Phosphoadenosine phosphosulphate reductase domain-containing protein n=1 Tax=Sphaerisporangium siamense TaxID=795645 RepID=A0A7W7D8D7_9ACTN|nr:hypothetical protein [Sphaerisporangium siamense]MBB4702195.1 hypothetical protein [Sphaerisporangium siamense]GII87111.1 hypothetical protein Ssi03_51010 [Sphaerisporangium siamense]